jgi:hypothetical protein
LRPPAVHVDQQQVRLIRLDRLGQVWHLVLSALDECRQGPLQLRQLVLAAPVVHLASLNQRAHW